MMEEVGQSAIPLIAHDKELLAEIERLAPSLATSHCFYEGDSRQQLKRLPAESVHLVITSPPYWTLKEYPHHSGQMGDMEDYDEFVNALNQVWAETFRVLVPGGRMVVVVGDVLIPRRKLGRHMVVPLHASIQLGCRELGFDNLAPVLWRKISNANFEAGEGSRFLGKPYEPNAVIKNDIEYILFQRKPGGYRSPSTATRVLSVIPADLHYEWFQQVWTLGGETTKRHPAPFPQRLAERLIRMFSFVGDVVLDPFMGTGTTNAAAARWGRNSIGVEIEPSYVRMAIDRIGHSQHAMRLEADD